MNSFKYFENRECRYYPCHKMPDNKGVNCLFCYCPLFHLKDCPGQYHYVEKKGRITKSCVDCSYIHDEDNYREILKLLRESDTPGSQEPSPGNPPVSDTAPER